MWLTVLICDGFLVKPFGVELDLSVEVTVISGDEIVEESLMGDVGSTLINWSVYETISQELQPGKYSHVVTYSLDACVYLF